MRIHSANTYNDNKPQRLRLGRHGEPRCHTEPAEGMNPGIWMIVMFRQATVIAKLKQNKLKTHKYDKNDSNNKAWSSAAVGWSEVAPPSSRGACNDCFC